MITVHHLEHSRSQRIPWLLEELGVDYAITRYARDRATGLAPEALKRIHPLGKAPVITDGDRVVAESGAIIHYLLDRHADGRLRPGPGSENALRYQYWMHYAEGTLMPLLVMSLILRRIDRAAWFIRPLARRITGQVRKAYLDPNIRLNVSFVEDTLRAQPWFAGEDFSACDIQMSVPLEALASGFGPDLAMPGIRGFLERIHARPAYQRARTKTGPLQPDPPA